MSRIPNQLRLLARISFLAGVPTALVLGLVYVVTRTAGIPFTSLSRDPAATYDFPWYGGSVSMLGVLIAAGAGAVSLVGAWIGRRYGDSLASLLGWFGAGMIWFAIDDGLMLHEEVFPNWIGIPEAAVMATYPLWVALLVVRFGRRIVAETDFGLLAGALLLLGIQGFLDLDLMSLPVSTAVLEDPVKIAALVLLFLYGCRIVSAMAEDRSLTR